VALAFGWLAQLTIGALARPTVQQTQAAVVAMAVAAATVQVVLASALTWRHAIVERAAPPVWVHRPRLPPPALAG